MDHSRVSFSRFPRVDADGRVAERWICDRRMAIRRRGGMDSTVARATFGDAMADQGEPGNPADAPGR